MASLLHLIIDPYYKMLGTQEGVESLVIKPIQFLYKPYYKKFAANDTIAESTSHENPFQPDQMLSTTEYMHWLQVQNAADHTIEYVIDFDMTEVKKMMIQMVEQMNAAFGGDTPKNEKKLKEISSLDMTMTNHSLFHFDLVSHAITTCDVFMQLDGHDGRKPRKSIKHLKYTITAELQ
jgi:hypothetical protein